MAVLSLAVAHIPPGSRCQAKSSDLVLKLQQHPRPEPQTELQHAWPRAAVEAFFSATATATCKLDGTNVGIDNKGKLFGRRLIIAKDLLAGISSSI